MLPEMKLFLFFRQLEPRKNCYGHIQSINGVRNMIRQSFCNVAESTKINVSAEMAESPEIPGWVKFSEGKNSVENSEDFVLPSVSYRINNAKLQDEGFELKRSDRDAAKISKILKDNFESPNDVIEALNGCDVSVSEDLVGKILRRFCGDWKQAFGFFKWAEIQMGSNHVPEFYNLMVDNLGRTKKFDMVRHLVEEMNHMKGYITLLTMSKVMRRLARARMYEEAIEAFNGLKQYGVSKDVEALNELMDALVKEQAVERAQTVYLKFKNHIPPNLHTFNILIHGWCKARQLDKARNIIEDMEQYGFYPDVVSYTNLIQAYCDEKDFQKVDAIQEQMQAKGCAANVITYTIIMHALGKAKEIGKALEVYERMKQNGFVADAGVYSSIIYILSKAGRLKAANDLFEDMFKQGVIPDARTYNTMISIACQNLQEENALKLLKRMDENRCRPDIDTYAPLLKMCCSLKRMKVLTFLLSHMFRNDVNVEIGTYALLVRGLCNSGLLEQACSFFEEAIVRGFVPRNSMYELLVKELEKKGLEKAKGHIEGLMLQAKNKPKTQEKPA